MLFAALKQELFKHKLRMKPYTKRANTLKEEFSLYHEKDLSGSPLEVKLLSFDSTVGVEERLDYKQSVLSPFSAISDNAIQENIHFVYPVFKHKKQAKSSEVIILMHGLNERSWDKYLPWAERLAMDTGKTVLLFPISFHINRAPLIWSNPRAMMPFVKERKKRIGQSQALSFLNIALSDRMSDSPFRFYSSGKQTVLNVMNLVSQIKNGEHPYMCKNAKVDIFAYSIGGLISQLLLMANPEDLFSETKLFLFCSGAVFLEMNGNTKSIMDSEAFFTLRNYYDKLFKATENSSITSVINEQVNNAFQTMISLRRKEERETFFEAARQRISTLSLKKDRVISTESIQKSLGHQFISTSHSELDFAFDYTHENPFPSNKEQIADVVNKSFDLVFHRAADFLG